MRLSFLNYEWHKNINNTCSDYDCNMCDVWGLKKICETESKSHDISWVFACVNPLYSFDHNAVDYSLPILFITIWIIVSFKLFTAYQSYIQSSSPSAPNLSSSLSLFCPWHLILYVRAPKFKYNYKHWKLSIVNGLYLSYPIVIKYSLTIRLNDSW